MTSNPRVVLAKHPKQGHLPVLGEHLIYDTSKTIDLNNIPLDGGFLTKTLILRLTGLALVVVLRSEKQGVKEGDYMFGVTTWEAYTVQPYIEGRVDFKPEDWPPATFNVDSEMFALRAVPNPNGDYPLSTYVNALGLPGLTAFIGFNALLGESVKEGNTIFVSSGASGVGSFVIQLAKEKGMKVIASAGSEKKVEYMRSIGTDIAFNYKTEGYESILSKHGPIHAFWDNVGGEAFDAALESMAPLARTVNVHLIMKKRLHIEGYLISDHLLSMFDRIQTELPALVVQGKLVGKENEVEGWDIAAQALLDVWKGVEEIGKPVIVVGKV
ncbi:hypothetical protein H0H93_003374 [Arthromyces matolae]|nr:hypothetical protein H0H93_003374 [Arthromyces matolae]